ncbi:ribonuclease P protein component [Cylindrospermum stagnale PCC 7417]|uniref:Ribonuclease P protein component n=1 Tax=Cylindrospermum stagnale PCC 7417 TaxID=56107 RepID=K9X1D2_9NOST|nr:ribonuclease P protein component [Cylindrospermum stagnale]AFZ25841.1 ribonuclease P protein component [Cylindrospermum stagnale PCC 7417]
MALPKANRLKSRKDFQAVFREGIRRHSSHFTLRALKPPRLKEPSMEAASKTGTASNRANLASTQIGISISTKVSKRAVVRNRIKRQISAAFYQLLPKLSLGWRLVVVVKPTAAESKCDRQQFLQELEQLLAQTEVFDGHS